MNLHLFASPYNLLMMSHANAKWWMSGLFYILHQQEMRQKCVGGTNHRFSALHTPVNFGEHMSVMASDCCKYEMRLSLPFCGGCLDQDG